MRSHSLNLCNASDFLEGKEARANLLRPIVRPIFLSVWLNFAAFIRDGFYIATILSNRNMNPNSTSLILFRILLSLLFPRTMIHVNINQLQQSNSIQPAEVILFCLTCLPIWFFCALSNIPPTLLLRDFAQKHHNSKHLTVRNNTYEVLSDSTYTNLRRSFFKFSKKIQQFQSKRFQHSKTHCSYFTHWTNIHWDPEVPHVGHFFSPSVHFSKGAGLGKNKIR